MFFFLFSILSSTFLLKDKIFNKLIFNLYLKYFFFLDTKLQQIFSASLQNYIFNYIVCFSIVFNYLYTCDILFVINCMNILFIYHNPKNNINIMISKHH